MELNGEQIPLVQLAAVAVAGEAVHISPAARPRISASRKLIEQIIARDAVIYGVTTGFGKLSDVRIRRDELQQLQLNLVRSHACGIGNPLSEPEVRAMMLLRANVLALGFSGVRWDVIELLCEMLNRRVYPIVPEKGSVGASGDLAPLAHLALSLVGEGEAFFEAQRMPSAEALQRAKLTPLELEAKEGLALLNGTQAMHAVGGLALLRAQRLARVADVAGAMSLEALKGTPAAFDLRLQDARPHPGQKAVAEHLLSLINGSEIRQSHLTDDPRVQDAYSLRCMPQVHGAIRGALAHGEAVLQIESASATDNPLVFAVAAGGDPGNGEVISGGNFHGAPLALAFDYAAIAIVDLMNISERRTDRLVNPDKNEGLPAFLARRPGLESGFMTAQVAAASLVNEARVLAHPASTDNITTSGGKEDHVSMGMTSALKLRSIVDLAENLLAIELLTAAEGLEHRRPLKAGVGVERAFVVVRKISPPLTQDRALAGDIACVAEAIRRGDFDDEGEKA
jgi:histidine ammonia-lyase